MFEIRSEFYFSFNWIIYIYLLIESITEWELSLCFSVGWVCISCCSFINGSWNTATAMRLERVSLILISSHVCQAGYGMREVSWPAPMQVVFLLFCHITRRSNYKWSQHVNYHNMLRLIYIKKKLNLFVRKYFRL